MATALPSATVMMVRDEPEFAVLMVRRHHQIEFASGALVFPGGKVEPSDADPAWADHLAGADGLSEEERAFRVCALREAFEESGILLAGDLSPEIARRAAAGRETVAKNEAGFRAFVAGLGVRLDLGALTPFAHWITPAAMPKRFDTRFYLADAPPDQVAACDGYETVDAEWIDPAEALRLQEEGQRTIVFPTRLNLRLLAGSTTATDARSRAAARPMPAIEPSVEKRADGLWVTIPDNVGHGSVPPQRL